MKSTANIHFHASTTFRRWLGLVSLGVILAAPSIWLLSKIPPLWKDNDAYLQVTQPAGIATILHYQPAYCFLARFPLFLGYALESFRRGTALPGLDFFQTPVLCDSGVLLLLVSQHLALLIASFAVLHAASGSILTRLLLGLLWASNPLFYTFAHCVGTETLSLIFLLLLSAIGLRLTSATNPRKGDWFIFALFLFLTFLTRHLNGLLAALLPTAFLLRAGIRLLVRQRNRADLKGAFIAVAVGLGCLLLANGTIRILSHFVAAPYHSQVGYTFMWRLPYLGQLSATQRNDVLDRMEREATPEGRVVLETWRTPPYPDSLTLLNHIRSTLAIEESDEGEARLGKLLNDVAAPFLIPPEPTLLETVMREFGAAWQMPEPEIVRHLFWSTTFFFNHPETMPTCATLATYRGRTAGGVIADLKHHRYFHQWKSCRYRTLVLVWLAGISVLAAFGKFARADGVPLVAYAISLMMIGWMMTLANSFFTEFFPRFAQPMWALTIVSASLVFGRIADQRKVRRAACRAG